MIDSIINHLQSQQLNSRPIFVRVHEAIDLRTAMKSELKQSPVAYVFEERRRVSNNEREMDYGPALQRVDTTVAVVIGVTKRNDKTGQKTKLVAQPVYEATRKALFGFQPSSEHSQLLLGNADTIGVNEHALWQMERFTTTHWEQADEHI